MWWPSNTYLPQWMRNCHRLTTPTHAVPAGAGRAGNRVQSHPNSEATFLPPLSKQEQQPPITSSGAVIGFMHALPHGFGLTLKLIFAIHRVQGGKPIKTHRAPKASSHEIQKGKRGCNYLFPSQLYHVEMHVFPGAFRQPKETATQGGGGSAARFSFLRDHKKTGARVQWPEQTRRTHQRLRLTGGNREL